MCDVVNGLLNCLEDRPADLLIIAGNILTLDRPKAHLANITWNALAVLRHNDDSEHEVDEYYQSGGEYRESVHPHHDDHGDDSLGGEVHFRRREDD